MNLNFRKTALLAGICSVFSLGYAPQLFAVSSTDTVEAVQQTKKITGVVSDAMGPIIGANVLEKGTTNGVITDIDGNFALNVKPGATIVVSFIGYVSQEIKITNQTTVNITLKEDSEMLDEVVVVGYGTMKKSDLSGASVSMSEDKIKGSIITNLDQSLQGRAAGVTAVSTSGAPGSSSSIRVRGQATINANAEPLYVIDGVIVQSQGQSGSSYGLGDALGNGSVSTISPLSTINPADIVSMEILKDASATAIYGAQGSNGVVLITTKRGKAGEAKFTYDGMFAVQRQTKRLDMMNLREYATYYNDLANMGEISDPSNYYADPSLLGVGTNWQDAIFQTALQHQHQISAQGGTEKIQYYVSASYMDQDGTIIGSNFNRYSFRANLDAQLKKWLKLGLTATYTATGDDLKLADSDEGLINYSLTTLPDIPIYNLDGSYATVVREGYTNPNPIALAMMDDILLDRQKLTGNIFFEVTPIKNLVWHAELGYDISSSKGERYKPMVDLGGWVRSSNESNIQKNSSTFWQLKNYVTYSGNIGDKHHYTAMVGQECWESSYDFTSVFNSGLPSDEVHNPALGTGTPTINAGFGSSSMASFFTRLTYNYADRYFIEYNGAYNGSEKFSPENRFAFFNSGAIGWMISEEPFMKFFREKKIIDMLKVRASYGEIGSDQLGPDPFDSSRRWLYMNQWAYGGNSRIDLNQTQSIYTWYREAAIGNKDIQWEVVKKLNIGVDYSLFEGMLAGSLEFFRDERSNIFVYGGDRSIPSYFGGTPPSINKGKIRTNGYELELRVNKTFGNDWRVWGNFSMTHAKNKVLVKDDQAMRPAYQKAAGFGVGQYTSYIDAGYIQNYDQLYGSPAHDANDSQKLVGDYYIVDFNGDGVVDNKDQAPYGYTSQPENTFNATIGFEWKGFSAFAQFYGVTNVTRDVGLTSFGSKLNTVFDTGTWWSKNTPNADVVVPRWNSTPSYNGGTQSLYDGSYIRLKNVELAYTWNKGWIKRIGLSNLKIYVNGNNLWLWTRMPDDREANLSGAGYLGAYPTVKRYNLGIKFTL